MCAEKADIVQKIEEQSMLIISDSDVLGRVEGDRKMEPVSSSIWRCGKKLLNA